MKPAGDHHVAGPKFGTSPDSSTGAIAERTPDTLCPYCGHAGRAWLTVPDDWRRPGTGPHDLWWCDACAYGWLAPRPRPADIPAFYDVEYYTHEKEEEDPAARGLGRRVLVHLAWRVDRGRSYSREWFLDWLPKPGARAADLGAGSGACTALLVESGADVLAVETDPRARGVIESRGIKAIRGLCESLPPEVPRHAFDLTLMSHVLEHTLDPARALRESASLLKPGGVLVVEVPNNEAVGLSRAGVGWYWLDVPRHLNFFTTRSLLAAIKRAGLRVERLEYRGYSRQFKNAWLRSEQHIASVLTPGETPGYATPLGQARLLARTAFARPQHKYDSVRAVARRPW